MHRLNYQTQICWRPPANHPDCAFSPRSRFPTRETNHIAVALLCRHHRSDAELLRFPTHAAGRRIGHHFLDARLCRHIRANLPQGTVRRVQRHHSVTHTHWSAANHTAAAHIWQRHRQSRPRPGDRRKRWFVGPCGGSVIYAFRRQRLCTASCAERTPFLRDNDQLWWIRSGLHLPRQLVAWRTVLAALWHRAPARGRLGAVQLPRPNPVDAVAANGASRTGGDRSFSGHCVCLHLAGVVLQGDTECVLGARRSVGG